MARESRQVVGTAPRNYGFPGVPAVLTPGQTVKKNPGTLNRLPFKNRGGGKPRGGGVKRKKGLKGFFNRVLTPLKKGGSRLKKKKGTPPKRVFFKPG